MTTPDKAAAAMLIATIDQCMSECGANAGDCDVCPTLSLCRAFILAAREAELLRIIGELTNVGRCALQNYERLNTALVDAANVLRKEQS